MALPLLMRQRQLGFKVEVTPGTAETITAAEATTNVMDSLIVPVGEGTKREGQSALSRINAVSGALHNKITFKTELGGKGSAALPAWADLMLASGMSASSLTLSPQTGNTAAKTLTFASLRDGVSYTSAGAMGNFKLAGTTGKPAVFDWEFLGSYIAPTDIALLAPTYETVRPPKVAGITLTIGAVNYPMDGFEISPNNKVEMREDVAQTFGFNTAVIVDREWTIKLKPEATLVATINWPARFADNTTYAINIVVGTGANLIWTINAPVAQLINPPVLGTRKDYLVNELEFLCLRSAAAGDDEITLVQS